ncbi:hypothetical protein N8T08_010798 [Aspergillus melleus]|uniref:Uncharacterized protein n=1 Tax=Aspergillus melleus TaxID=138277 RepID=A0ACC3BD14_9EURO|nr:hypothetical protein N8T08_010798 [Aspergillus melleus]
MAEEQLHFNPENALHFPLLGSPAAQAADALGQVGSSCLKALYTEATAKQSQLEQQKRKKPASTWAEVQTHTCALERALHEIKTPTSPSHVLGRHHDKNPPLPSRPSTPVARRATGGALLASSAGKRIPPVAWIVLEMRIRRERDDHEAFMRALSPDTKAAELLAQGSTEIREHLLADVKRAIAGPLPIEEFHPETARDEGIFDRPSLSDLDEAHRADTAWEQQTNTWRIGLELGPMLECTEYTDSETPQIVQTARHLLTMPRLASILQQRFPDGTTGDHVIVHGHDGSSYTFDKLAFHPTYCHLMEEDELWNTLHSPAMNRLLDQAHQSQPLAGFTTVDLQRLAMAQRIASVVIHVTVRDFIHYNFGGWQQTALEVLRARQGSCSGSANLTVALARAARVPAGAIRLHVVAPGYFGRVAIPNAVGGPNRVSVHYQVGWVTMQSAIDGGFTWQIVRSDPSDEFEIGAGLEHFNCPRSRVTHFDGSHDCVLLFPPEEVLDDVGPLANIDCLLRKQRPQVPSIPQRLQLLRTVHAHGPVAVIEQVASQIIQSPYQGRYDLVAQSYKATQESLSDRGYFPREGFPAVTGVFEPSVDAGIAFSFLLGKNSSRYRDPQGEWHDNIPSICKNAGIFPEHLHQIAQFHAHLLSDVATVTWERYSCFMRQHAEGIRISTDCAVEFEAWFPRRDPILAALHRDDLSHDHLYPESVYRYLQPRAVARTPPLIRIALTEFIELIETQPDTMRPNTSAELDSLLHNFLRERTVVSIEAVVGERRGGWLKPYGVFSQEQSYRSEQDWLGEVAKSYPYQSWDSSATETPGWKAVAML